MKIVENLIPLRGSYLGIQLELFESSDAQFPSHRTNLRGRRLHRPSARSTQHSARGVIIESAKEGAKQRVHRGNNKHVYAKFGDGDFSSEDPTTVLSNKTRFNYDYFHSTFLFVVQRRSAER